MRGEGGDWENERKLGLFSEHCCRAQGWSYIFFHKPFGKNSCGIILSRSLFVHCFLRWWILTSSIEIYLYKFSKWKNQWRLDYLYPHFIEVEKIFSCLYLEGFSTLYLVSFFWLNVLGLSFLILAKLLLLLSGGYYYGRIF